MVGWGRGCWRGLKGSVSFQNVIYKIKSKGERQIQPEISSLSVVHSLEHTKRFTELGREEKEEGGERGDQGEKGESKGGGESGQASNLAPK